MEMMMVWGFIIVLIVASFVFLRKINELEGQSSVEERDIRHLANEIEKLREENDHLRNKIIGIEERVNDIELKMSVITDERTRPYYDS